MSKIYNYCLENKDWITGLIKMHCISDKEITIDASEVMQSFWHNIQRVNIFPSDIDDFIRFRVMLEITNYCLHKMNSTRAKRKWKEIIGLLISAIEELFPQYYGEMIGNKLLNEDRSDYFINAFPYLSKLVMISHHGGYLYKTLAFCILELLNGWTANLFIEHAHKNKLDLSKYSNYFFNQYAKETETPTFIILNIFYEYEEKQKYKLIDILHPSDLVSPVIFRDIIEEVVGSIKYCLFIDYADFSTRYQSEYSIISIEDHSRYAKKVTEWKENVRSHVISQLVKYLY